MFKHAKIALLAALIAPAAAFAQINIGDDLGVSETAVQAALEAQGYTVTEIEFETDEIEAEVILDGQAFEIEISPETGLVVAVELEDDEDDEDGADDSEDDEDADDA